MTIIEETFRDVSKLVVTYERQPEWKHALLRSLGMPIQRIIRVDFDTSSPPLNQDTKVVG